MRFSVTHHRAKRWGRFRSSPWFLNPAFTAVAVPILVIDIALAGGGLVLQDDMCILEIDFYSAHFTAYQPTTRGSEQFCRELPGTGETIFVLDYLHDSLREVPVEMRIIRDATAQGRFVKAKHVDALGDLAPHTVAHQPPLVRADGSFQLEFTIDEPGAFVGIVTAGHPTSDATYTALFPFEAGGARLPWIGLGAAAALMIALAWWHRRRTAGPTLEPEGT